MSVESAESAECPRPDSHQIRRKTSLARALSQKASTAAFDKNPQSQERGITLDLGFSAFQADGTQYTLVDCPGHASLIKTILGGAQIIDTMVLVVDVTKGFQTQTAECLVVGEITGDSLIVALNKIDSLDASKKEAKLAKAVKKVRKTLEGTKFADAAIIPVSAAEQEGLDDLIAAIASETADAGEGASSSSLSAPDDGERSEPFIFLVDHTFTVRGHGTVVTGTVQRGRVEIGDMVEVPSLGLTQKVRSIQMFGSPVNMAQKGDRVGINIPQLPADMERVVIATPGAVKGIRSAVLCVDRIRFFRRDIATGTKLHFTVGHQTTLGTPLFFRSFGTSDADQDLLRVQGLLPTGDGASSSAPTGAETLLESQYLALETLENKDEYPPGSQTYAVVDFETTVYCPGDALVIASRLDEEDKKVCRIAFSGQLAIVMDADFDRTSLSIWKPKVRTGTVVRLKDEYTAIVKSMFTKAVDPSLYTGLRVLSSDGLEGRIEGSFGKSNKISVRFASGGMTNDRDTISLHHRKYVYSSGEGSGFVQ